MTTRVTDINQVCAVITETHGPSGPGLQMLAFYHVEPNIVILLLLVGVRSPQLASYLIRLLFLLYDHSTFT